MDSNFIEAELKQHGELHLVVEEHEPIAGDDYIGIRLGNTEFNGDRIHIDDGNTEHIIDASSVIYLHKPVEFPD
jgi:hypothetical protein